MAVTSMHALSVRLPICTASSLALDVALLLISRRALANTVILL
jgi:hypothetical protein